MGPARKHGRNTRFRRLAAVAAAAGTVLAAAAIPADASADTAAGARTCRDVTIPAKVGPLDVSVHGVLCTPDGPAKNTVQLLLHGGTYNASYWDYPVAGGRYSYARQANSGGYTTLAIDRLGSGTSSRPLSALVTVDSQANVVHQIVGRLKAGEVTGAPADRVALVGHSMGTGVASVETTAYHDVDAVVLTGGTSQLDTGALLKTLTSQVWPAALDPAFGPLIDPLYLTTRPGLRAAAFHDAGDVDPEVVQYDESTKDVASPVELSGVVLKGFSPDTTRKITVPTMLQVGSRDRLFCAPGNAADCASPQALARAQATAFGPAARLHTSVLPGAGHDLQLARNGADAARDVTRWLDTALPAQ
ncbi:alpha/beta hydrolase [Amycolatopsis rubida]|uniref:Lysophospholipase, alpha-beta hydrolase superfamily n=1 Tax=Amycolatopsis rubida TaxID=112413 RepID=A0A1I5XCR8_9PSEU|nr:alpha/beta hydrolase [Amycolatopsis rubida]SFQ29765.1 Lysophospholipase, alpha-beta hydrolase superfamily [Amycolatopsis rubida]